MAQSSRRSTQNTSAGANPDGASTTYCVLLSALLHVVLLVGLVFMPALAPAKKRIPSVVSVSLVSLPADGTTSSPVTSPAVRKAAETLPTGKRQPPLSKTTEKVFIPQAKPKPKTSLKYKTFKSSKVVKSAVDRIEKQLTESPPPSLEKELERLKREVGDSQEKPPGGSTTSQDRAAAGSSTAGGGCTRIWGDCRRHPNIPGGDILPGSEELGLFRTAGRCR